MVIDTIIYELKSKYIIYYTFMFLYGNFALNGLHLCKTWMSPLRPKSANFPSSSCSSLLTLYFSSPLLSSSHSVPNLFYNQPFSIPFCCFHYANRSNKMHSVSSARRSLFSYAICLLFTEEFETSELSPVFWAWSSAFCMFAFCQAFSVPSFSLNIVQMMLKIMRSAVLPTLQIRDIFSV